MRYYRILCVAGNGSCQGRGYNCCMGKIVDSALTLGESKFLKAYDIETTNPTS